MGIQKAREAFEAWFKKRHMKTGLYEKALLNDADALYVKHEMRKAWHAAFSADCIDFQKWFKTQPFYEKLIYQYGDRLFDRDGEVYRAQPVDIAYRAYKRTPGNE